MDLKLIIIFLSNILIKTVSLQPHVVYKPTEFPYSRCLKHDTNRVTCEKLNISKERKEKQSMWPPGPYAIRMSKYGCPESLSRGWLKSFVKVNMVVLSNSSEKNTTISGRKSGDNFLFIGDDFFKSPYQTEDLKLYFCVKFRNDVILDQGQWIPGNYSIYRIGTSCPLAFEEYNRTLPVTHFVSYGHVPYIEISTEGQSTDFINISMCKRTKFIGTGDIHTNVTFKMLETDFILEKV
ncbi:uncharacterized protein LOC132748797 [Ruditapes philippinarum]|uniref:uncharacterized protein LOC132748797 n=1 Tax=Ruditapes philippinarum TaxID=129788 RepID=UPI00295B3B9F|nr:uncharacterized protein LOC132748797 [Ruditapes philippinarum]